MQYGIHQRRFRGAWVLLVVWCALALVPVAGWARLTANAPECCAARAATSSCCADSCPCTAAAVCECAGPVPGGAPASEAPAPVTQRAAVDSVGCSVSRLAFVPMPAARSLVTASSAAALCDGCRLHLLHSVLLV